MLVNTKNVHIIFMVMAVLLTYIGIQLLYVGSSHLFF